MSANAFNLARRLSARNENDLLQEDFMSNNDDDSMTSSPTSSPVYNRKTCFAMLDRVCPDSPLPPECAKFEDVKVALQRKNSNKSAQAIAFQGMDPGSAAAAMAQRDRGHLHHAQIQRRMSTNKNRKLW